MPDWRILICDKYGRAISNISAIAVNRKYSEALSVPTSLAFDVDPEHPLVSKIHLPDGAPYLDYIRRTVKMYRQEVNEAGNTIFKHRFTGYIWPIQDEGSENDQVSRIVAYDPLHIMSKRMARGSDGSMLSVPFTATDAGQILKTVVDRTNFYAGQSGLITTDGIYETIGNATVEWRLKKISEVISEMTGRSELWVEPLDTLTQYHGRLHCYIQRGIIRDGAVFGWRYAPNNLDGITRVMDADDAANVVVGVGATGTGADQLLAVGVDATNIGQFMQLEEVLTWSDATDQTYLDALTADALRDRLPPNQTLILGNPVDTKVEPWRDFETGDTVIVNAHPALRGGLPQKEQRIYGFSLTNDDMGNEAMELVTSAEDAGG